VLTASASAAERRSWVSDLVVPVDEHEPPTRGALVVVAVAGRQWIVDERDRCIELVRVQAHERALLVDRFAVETCGGEDFEDVGDGCRLEDDLVATGGQLDRLGPRQSLGGSTSAEDVAVQFSQANGGVAGDTVGTVAPGDARQAALDGFADHDLARRVAKPPDQ
jgi:hypothetical protein